MNKTVSPEEKLFSKINHDLRGSFVSILGYSSILADPNEEVTEDEIKEFVTRIDSRSKETYELLESFTNWLKIERYSESLLKEKVNLFESITSIQLLFKNEFISKDVSVNISIDKSVTIMFDIVVIQSLLKNIFLFVTKSIKENSGLNIFYLPQKNNSTLKFEYNSQLSEREISTLAKLKNDIIEYSNVPNEILLSKRFVELSNGSFLLNILDENKIVIEIIFS